MTEFTWRQFWREFFPALFKCLALGIIIIAIGAVKYGIEVCMGG